MALQFIELLELSTAGTSMLIRIKVPDSQASWIDLDSIFVLDPPSRKGTEQQRTQTPNILNQWVEHIADCWSISISGTHVLCQIHTPHQQIQVGWHSRLQSPANTKHEKTIWRHNVTLWKGNIRFSIFKDAPKVNKCKRVTKQIGLCSSPKDRMGVCWSNSLSFQNQNVHFSWKEQTNIRWLDFVTIFLQKKTRCKCVHFRCMVHEKTWISYIPHRTFCPQIVFRPYVASKTN